MAAVAKRFVLGMFAAAPSHGLGGGDIRFDRREFSALVGAVAKRLGSGSAAGAPPISASFDFLHDGTFLENSWIAHALSFNPARHHWQTKSHPSASVPPVCAIRCFGRRRGVGGIPGECSARPRPRLRLADTTALAAASQTSIQMAAAPAPAAIAAPLQMTGK